MRARNVALLATTTLLAAAAASVAAGRCATRAALGGHRGPGGHGRTAVPAGFRNRTLTVRASAPGSITVNRTPDAAVPGRYAITSGRGAERTQAELGVITADDEQDGTVTRRLARVTGPLPTPGSQVQLTPQLYRGNPRSAHGMAYTSVEIPAELGPLPAWFIPGSRELWIIALHGLGATREQPLNLLPLLHAFDFPVLLPVYRGDTGAPTPDGGIGRLGAAEWRDADAVVRHAVRYGARRILLYGWSAGATMALHTAVNSPLRDRISGLVLDSPVLDWPATLRALASEQGVPSPVLPLASGAAQDGAGLGRPAPPPAPVHADGTPKPVLLLHGPQDSIAPYAASRTYAARHQEGVVLHTVHHAEHAAMWNANPEAYEEILREFLTPLA